MKKITRLLLVLAAAVVMTVGAAGTVLAADVIIDTWAGDYIGGWTAKDTNGNTIERGWAISDSGIWYYFDSGRMLRNSFITYMGKIYFLGADGAMATSWVEFGENTAVNFNKVGYATVADALGEYYVGADEDILPFSSGNDGAYRTLWCYFNEDGTLVRDAWIEENGLWYYIKGSFCLMNEYSATLPMSNDSREYAKFGFSKNGNMHVGWLPIYNSASSTVKKGPYATEEVAASDVDKWLYYSNSGVQAGFGWNRIDGNWYYFERCGYGTSILTDTLLTEDDTDYTFYFDKDGMMRTGMISFGSASSDVTVRARRSVNGTVSEDIDNYIMLDAKEYVTLNFKNNGIMSTGIVGRRFYATAKSETHLHFIQNKDISPAANKVTATYAGIETVKGAKIAGNFFYAEDIDNIYYFENGYLVRNDTVTYGNVTLAFDDDGRLVQLADRKSLIVGNTRYYFDESYGTLVFKDLYSNVAGEVNQLTVNGASIKK